jgi:hypothetical protein
MKQFVILVSVMALMGLGGCSTIKKVTGQTNDTVLPGQREDILPPEQETARDPIVTGQEPKPCDPTKTKCAANVAQ